MPLTIQKYKPIFICEVCGEVIEADQGAVLFNTNEEEPEMFFAHRGECFCRLLKTKQTPGDCIGDLPLDYFLALLMKNTGLKLDFSCLTEDQLRSFEALNSL